MNPFRSFSLKNIIIKGKIIPVLGCCFFFFFIFIFKIIHHHYVEQLNHFILSQQTGFQKVGYQLTYQSASNSPWQLFPSRTLYYPRLSTQKSHQILQQWEGKKINFSYSLLHPLSISIHIEGEQRYCFSFFPSCLQTYGKDWSFYIPLSQSHNNITFNLSVPKLFFTLPINPYLTGTVKLDKLYAKVKWDLHDPGSSQLFFTQITAHKLSFSSKNISPYTVKGVKFQMGLTIPQHSSKPYLMLLQQLQGQSGNIRFNGNGKFYLSHTTHLPTGELFLYINGIRPFLLKQFIKRSRIQSSHENSVYNHFPNHLTIPLAIREGEIYLGSIPIPPQTLTDVINKRSIQTHP